MNRKILLFIFILIVSACTSPQVTEETDCCLPVDFTMPAPTETQTPTLIFTETPYPTFVYDATQKAFQTKVAEFPRLCPENVPYFSDFSHGSIQISPDGLWLAEMCLSFELKDFVLTISNKETRDSWNIFYKDYIPNLDFVPDGGIFLVHWSNDSRYLYFTTFLGGDGGECYLDLTETGVALFRVDLQTKQVSEILPLIKDNFRFYDFSISPTDKYLIYKVDKTGLKILDISTGISKNIQHIKEFHDSGGYVWSPDEQELIYSTLLYKNEYERDSYTLRLVNIKTGDEEILLESKMNCYLAKEWKNNNILLIEYDYSLTTYNRALMEYDLITNTIVNPLVTPQP